MTTFSFLAKCFAVGAVAASYSSNCAANAATFVDDRGIEFTWDNTQKAKIAARAGIAGISLFHMGMTADQLVASWGLWAIRGSDFNPEDPLTPGTFPEDPDPEAAEFLASSINLSPSCWQNPRGCFQMDNYQDVADLYNNGEIDFVVNVDNGAGGDSYTEIEEAGVPVIFIDTFFDYHPNCRMANYSRTDEFCYGRSMIDINMRLEELAVFLGVDTNTEELNAQKQAACEAAEAFTDAMADVHQKGIRVKLSILGSGRDEETGESYVTVRDFDPIKLWVARTLEELGMPLLHAGNVSTITANEYFSNCDPGMVNQTCNGDTAMAADFWLIDSRSFRNIDDNFKLAFPDRAFLANQYWHYPRNDGGLSYPIITTVLTDLTRELSNAQKVLDIDGPDCIAIDPKDITHRASDGTGGLESNEFVCYNKDLIEQEYLKCPPVVVPPPVDAPVAPPVEAPVAPPVAAPVTPPEPVDASEQNADSSANGVSFLWSTILFVAAGAVYLV